MDSSQIVIAAVLAVLVFWAVGAHNRLVQLRHAIVAAFAPVDEQFRLRHALLLRQADALAARLGERAAPETLEPLRAACGQAEGACLHARSRPGASGAITSLRLAEDILGEARTRLPPAAVDDAELAQLAAELAALDSTLGFARRKFNDAVEVYNHAVQQFPTLVIAGLFRFRTAGLL